MIQAALRASNIRCANPVFWICPFLLLLHITQPFLLVAMVIPLIIFRSFDFKLMVPMCAVLFLSFLINIDCFACHERQKWPKISDRTESHIINFPIKLIYCCCGSNSVVVVMSKGDGGGDWFTCHLKNTHSLACLRHWAVVSFNCLCIPCIVWLASILLVSIWLHSD